MDISHWVRHRADWSPDRVAVHFAGVDVTYAEMHRRVTRLAAALADDLRIAPGDRVAFLGYNSPVLLDLLFACARLGAVLVPLNWRLTVAEHRFIVADAGPRAVFVEPEFCGHAEDLRDGALALVACEAPPGHTRSGVPLPDRGAWRDYAALTAGAAADPMAGDGDLAAPLLVVYTSGTTGRPKGAVLSQGAVFWNALNSIAAHDMTSADHVLAVLPMFHVGGLNIQTTPAILAGATITIARRFDPDETLDLFAARRPTLFLAVPAVAQALSRHRRFTDTDLSSLRAICTGSSTVPEAVIRPWMERGIPVTQVYGMTESGPTAIALSIADAARKVGSCGKPVAHCAARIVDGDGHDVPAGQPGEIWLRGPNLMTGYWRNPGATVRSLHRRVAPHGRHRPPGRRRLLLHRRPQKGRGDLRRREHLSSRARTHPRRLPPHRRSRRDRPPRPRLGRNPNRLHRPKAEHHAHPRRSPRALPRPPSPLQAPPRRHLPGSPTPHSHGQSPETRTPPPTRTEEASRAGSPITQSVLSRREATERRRAGRGGRASCRDRCFCG